MHKSNPTLHPIDPALVSAYYDSALEPAEQAAVEEHLARCHTCRDRLAGYGWLGRVMQRDQDTRIPVRLDRGVTALVQRRRGSKPYHASLVQPVWAAVAIAGMAAIVTLALFPLGGAGGPSVASAYPCDDPADCAVAVRFDGPVDRDSVERSVQLDPPVAVAVAWRGDTLLVRPAEPLQPKASYTLSLKPQGLGADSTPVAVYFVAGSAASPVAMATTYEATASPPAASSSPVTATSAPPSPSATPCGVQLARDFGNLYRSQPAAILKLGCARVTELGVEATSQSFKAGRLLRRGDRREIVVLLNNGTWRSYPDTFDGTEAAIPTPGAPIRGFGNLWREQPDLQAALGAATGPEQSIGSVIQEFERGLLIRTADHLIYALYADNSWARYADTSRDTTATATPTPTTTFTLTATVTLSSTITTTATVSPTATITPTTAARLTTTATPAASPSARPNATVPAATVTPSATRCSVQPVRGLGLVYRDHPTVATRLGCARTIEVAMPIVRQTFEHGTMLWRSDQRQIAVLLGEGAWSVYPDTWRDGDVLTDAGTPPAGRFTPQRSFGKLWRQQPTVREPLGWSTAEEQSLSGAVQEFVDGWMLRTSDRMIYVLYSDGTWQSFPDTFVEPTATPTIAPARR